MIGLDVELNVIGCCLLNEDSAATALALLAPADFQRDENRIIWGVMQSIAERGRTPNTGNIVENLRRQHLLKPAGGVEYINSITDTLPATIDVEEQCVFLKEHAMMARIKSMAAKVDTYDNPNELLEFVQREMDLILSRDGFESSANAGDIADSLIREAMSIQSGDMVPEGVTTGFTGLDRFMTILSPGELIIIASRPGVGKSALATNILTNVSVAQKKSSLMVSLEMSGREVVSRIIGNMESVNTMAFKTGRFDLSGSPNDLERIESAEKKLRDSRLVIDDRGSLNIAQLKALARKVKAKNGLDLIVVDYLQLMEGRGSTRNEVIGSITRGLKMLAKDISVPVVALSQMRRRRPGDNEGDDKTAPELDELRESGNIEQDADKVIFISRGEGARKATINIAKQRSGPVGFASFSYTPEYCRFEDSSFVEDQ